MCSSKADAYIEATQYSIFMDVFLGIICNEIFSLACCLSAQLSKSAEEYLMDISTAAYK